MSNVRFILRALLLVTVLVLAACEPASDSESEPEPASSDESPVTSAPDEGSAVSGAGDVDTWLQQINSGELPLESRSESFDWALGYLLYYGPVESLGVDNLIYNAQRVNRRLDTGEVTMANLSQNDQNLLELTEGIEFDPDVDPTEQIGQTPAIREAILDRIVASQADLSPEEALASNEVVGVLAPPAPEALGAKYLVYTQETPDSDFEFLGVVIVADATTDGERETYTFQGWEGLPWLGDAAGPFWNDLPAGVSGDPANTDEGRPGVLLVSESAYEEIKAGNLE
jgi:hypothetical protein